jgi:hypothetical protein
MDHPQLQSVDFSPWHMLCRKYVEHALQVLRSPDSRALDQPLCCTSFPSSATLVLTCSGETPCRAGTPDGLLAQQMPAQGSQHRRGGVFVTCSPGYSREAQLWEEPLINCPLLLSQLAPCSRTSWGLQTTRKERVARQMNNAMPALRKIAWLALTLRYERASPS